jgi:hypothetical protein
MIRIIAKVFAVTVALTAFLHVAPLFAATVGYVSGTGSDSNSCTAAAPCATFIKASQVWPGSSGEIACLDFPSVSEPNLGISANVTFDCAGVLNATEANAAPITLQQGGTLKIRNLTISGTAGGYPAIKVNGGGTLILENCVFENFSGTALDIEPTGALNLVITNSRISNNAGGVLLKPAAGGSVTATFDGVRIVDNTGGGLKTDTTN